MLVELHVVDLGIVADLNLVLGPGLTAITGETGAGKTLIVEAVELLVGGRADASLVRGEFADAAGQLHGVAARQKKTAVTLRLPWLAAATEVRLVALGRSGDSELGRVAYPQVQP